MKPGLKTTEFWTTVIGNLVALGVTVGVMNMDNASNVTESVALIAQAITAVGTIWGYTFGRSTVKAETIEA